MNHDRELSKFMQMVFRQQRMVEEQIAKTHALDRQAEVDEAKFIESLGS